MTKKPSLSSEDSDYFQHAMRDVTPLKTPKPKLNLKPAPPPAGPVRRKAVYSAPKSTTLWDLADYYAEPVQAESLLYYQQPGVSKAQTQALKTGNLTYQAKLDLHGLKPDSAKDRLIHFLQGAVENQQRWVLIIHGKGGQFGEAPVLKNLVNRWLMQIPIVLAFHSAHPKHGGTGAVYVLLQQPKTR